MKQMFRTPDGQLADNEERKKIVMYVSNKHVGTLMSHDINPNSQSVEATRLS